MNQSETERLRQFFGAYFHQDWMLDDADAEAVIARFIADHPDKQELASLAALVEEYASTRSEQELAASLSEELWCEYSPSVAGVSVGEWLQHVANRLRSEAVAR